MELQKTVRRDGYSGRCGFASISFQEMMVPFSLRGIAMIVYIRETDYSLRHLDECFGLRIKNAFRTIHKF
jgi:hypothetical protein